VPLALGTPIPNNYDLDLGNPNREQLAVNAPMASMEGPTT